jgi:murein DD-endopeptidase MepM/ murein hydrolase activator NlpD
MSQGCGVLLREIELHIVIAVGRIYITISSAILAVAAAIAVIALWRRKGVDPVKGTVSSNYGVRSSGFHNGTDIAVPAGTPVRSPWRGTVIDTYSNAQGGLQMIIDHPNGYRTGYAHLSETVAAKGDKVRRGQVVAKSGNTGHSTGPHLHFTLRKNGERIDPESVFDFK